MKSKGTSRRKQWTKQRLRASFHDYFLISERERRGLRILFVIILIVWSIKAWVLPMLPEESIEIGPVERILLEMHEKELEASIQIERFGDGSLAQPLNPEGKINPNQVEMEELLGMGIPIKVAKTWTNYLRSGGRFHQPDDLLRIYGFKKEWLDVMDGHLTWFSDSLAGNGSLPRTKSKLASVELNAADSALLVSLPGIGSILASRIIKYRNILGGYHDLNQLLDVYGLDTVVFGRVSALLNVDTTLIRTLNVNSCDFQTLNRHPCISRDLAYEIIEHLEKYGEIRQLNRLASFNSLPALHQVRLQCYLSVENRKDGG